MRLYVPATLDLLATWHSEAVLPVGATAEAFEAPDDTEEGEYAALMSAADASAELAGRERRRVVIVVDGPGPSYPSSTWAAIHADSAQRPVDADPDDDLAWWAIPEIGDLLA
jgi:hypothetical protein